MRIPGHRACMEQSCRLAAGCGDAAQSCKFMIGHPEDCSVPPPRLSK